MNHLGTPQTKTARKKHRCSWCGENILRGERYKSQFVVWEGDPWTKKMHMECADAEEVYDFDGDVISYDGSFQRGHSHELNWSSAEDGVAIGCPGCIKEDTGRKSAGR